MLLASRPISYSLSAASSTKDLFGYAKFLAAEKIKGLLGMLKIAQPYRRQSEQTRCLVIFQTNELGVPRPAFAQGLPVWKLNERHVLVRAGSVGGSSFVLDAADSEYEIGLEASSMAKKAAYILRLTRLVNSDSTISAHRLVAASASGNSIQPTPPNEPAAHLQPLCRESKDCSASSPYQDNPTQARSAMLKAAVRQLLPARERRRTNQAVAREVSTRMLPEMRNGARKPKCAAMTPPMSGPMPMPIARAEDVMP